MKLMLIFACILAVTIAAPTPEDERRRLPALDHTEVRDSRGQYDLSYRTAEGTEVRETGRLVTVMTPEGEAQFLQVEGETKYIGDDGKVYVTKYNAGLDGSHVEGAHLPVSVVDQSVPRA